MAAFGRPAALLPPDYLHEPSDIVCLEYPFALDGAKVEQVVLAPPSLDGLELLRGEGGISARTILLVTSPLPLRAIGALRWPDVETLLTAALGLLPPDLVDRVGPVVGQDEASLPSTEDAGPVDGSARDSPNEDVGTQLGLDPSDFSLSI